jgi:hypothetical protein
MKSCQIMPRPRIIRVEQAEEGPASYVLEQRAGVYQVAGHPFGLPMVRMRYHERTRCT